MWLRAKADSNLSRHYLPTIRASNSWINKALFRVVFGKGIVPAVPPLGPWLERRESTLCNTPGGYEEQMSCLLLSSSRRRAAHTSLEMTGWKAEPRKAQSEFGVFFSCLFQGGGWLFPGESSRGGLFVAGLVAAARTEFRKPP